MYDMMEHQLNHSGEKKALALLRLPNSWLALLLSQEGRSPPTASAAINSPVYRGLGHGGWSSGAILDREKGLGTYPRGPGECLPAWRNSLHAQSGASDPSAGPQGGEEKSPEAFNSSADIQEQTPGNCWGRITGSLCITPLRQHPQLETAALSNFQRQGCIPVTLLEKSLKKYTAYWSHARPPRISYQVYLMILLARRARDRMRCAQGCPGLGFREREGKLALNHQT
ncbi:hypothetical protein VTK56DRAFT_8450 [Thermocarpiscus australiensis]